MLFVTFCYLFKYLIHLGMKYKGLLKLYFSFSFAFWPRHIPQWCSCLAGLEKKKGVMSEVCITVLHANNGKVGRQ